MFEVHNAEIRRWRQERDALYDALGTLACELATSTHSTPAESLDWLRRQVEKYEADDRGGLLAGYRLAHDRLAREMAARKRKPMALAG